MRQYTITKITGAPDWSKIPALDVDNYLWCEPLDIKMKTQVCYDETGLHVHLRAWEKDPEKVTWREYSFGNLKLHLCGPARGDGKVAFVGYFHAELTDDVGRVHILPGQLSLARPAGQLDGLRCITALCELMDGLRVEPDAVRNAAGA